MIARLSKYLWAITLLCLLPVGSLSSQKNIRFHFAPADGLSFKVVETKKTDFFEGNKRQKRIESESSADYEISRREGGYYVNATRTSFEVSSDGKKAQSSIADAANGVQLTIMLDSLGRAVEVFGVDAIIANLESALGKDVSALTEQLMPPGEFENQILSDWNDRTIPFLNQPADSGAVFYHSVEIDEPFGKPVMFGRSVIASVFESGGKQLAKVLTSSFSNLDLLSRHFGIPQSELLPEFSLDSATAARLLQQPFMANKQQERVIEINTLLTIYEESELEMVRFEIDANGDTTAVGMERKLIKKIEF